MCALCSVGLQAGSKVHCVACCVHSRRVKHDKRVSSFVSVRAKVAGEARGGLAGQAGVQRARKSSISHGRGEKLSGDSDEQIPQGMPQEEEWVLCG